MGGGSRKPAKPLKLAFDAEIGGEKVRLAVVQPSAAVKQHGRLVHAKAFRDAVAYGAMVREDLDAYLRREQKWDDERQREYDRLRKTLIDGERRLAKGGIRLKEARQIALDMAKARGDLTALLGARNRADTETADAFADQAQFNYLVASCTVFDETGKPVFTGDGEHPSTEDYVERGTEQYAYDAADRLSELLYGNAKDMMEKLPENQFLRKFGFVDGDLNLVDDRGRRVDDQGRLLDADGRFINERGEYVDGEGNQVDKEGNFVVDEEPFLDDDGRPIDIGGEGAGGEEVVDVPPAPPELPTFHRAEFPAVATPAG